MTQPTLFDAPATRGASRKSDPTTAVAAGRSMSGAHLRDQQRLVLHAAEVCGHWAKGATAYEVWSLLNRQGNRIKENVVSKRLGELAELGMVRLTGATRPGSSHRHQQVFEVTEDGRSVA